MNYYAGIDVSLEYASVCVVDGAGKIVSEGKVLSDPAALIGWFRKLGRQLLRIGLEAGPLSQFLYAKMREAGLGMELLETRHVRNALKTMPVKTDRNDARGIAQLMRLGWFRPVHCKSLEAQETRALLTTRELVQSKLHDVEMSLRGILRNFGLKVGPTTAIKFEARIRELAEGHPNLELIAARLLAVRTVLRRELEVLEKQVRGLARCDQRTRLLMTVPAVGYVISMTYSAAIDDPHRFKSSKVVGAYFGLTPTRYQSGQTDVSGRISRIGDVSVRAALYEAAHLILVKPIRGCTALKSWAMRIAKRCGMKKAKVALARKLAVIMHRMLVDGTAFCDAAAAR